MDVKPYEVKIRDVVEGYINSDEEGVIGYSGNLNIRPKYQREFIYDEKKQKAVIDTIINKYPLNVMYWAINPDGSYEVLDGQQRTLSFCQFKNHGFSINWNGTTCYFDNLPDTIQEKILDYDLMVYICDGNDDEKLRWFKTINIAGERLYDQELLNAIYTGEWLTDAKRHFSKTNCPAYNMANQYMKGICIRQDYLETVLEWIADRDNTDIQTYMALHQFMPNATELWLYFNSVIAWVNAVFPKYRKEMQGVEWGLLYNKFKDNTYDANELETKIAELMLDEDVTKKQGIYSYVLDGDERNLSIRAFTPKMKREAYERQQGICTKCNKHYSIGEMEADHITPWHLGGPTIASNCQMLCKECNRRKSGK